jgi:hypothetical protein
MHSWLSSMHDSPAFSSMPEQADAKIAMVISAVRGLGPGSVGRRTRIVSS